MKSSISTHIQKVVQEKINNQEPSSSNVIHKTSKYSALEQIRNDQLKFLINHRKNQSNQRTNEAVGTTSRSIENAKLPTVIDITETKSKMFTNNQQIRSSELDSSIEVLSTEADISIDIVSTVQTENKRSSKLDNSIEVVSTLQSESTVKLNQYSLIENMDDDQFINLICRLFHHVDKEEFSKMVRKFNKSYNKVLILQTFISKSEEEGIKVPEEAYKYLSRISSNKRRSESEMENGLGKHPKLEKASISINFNKSNVSPSIVNASVSNNVCLKETHNEEQPKLSSSKAPYTNYPCEVKSSSLGLNTFTNKSINIRKTFIEEKTQFICSILQNTNKEFIRKQVEKCYTDEDVEILLNEQLEKEQLSSNDKQNPSKNFIEASTSTSPSIPSNNSIPLELVNNTYSLVSKALDKHETYK